MKKTANNKILAKILEAEAFDKLGGFGGLDDVKSAKVFCDGAYVDALTGVGKDNDVQVELYNGKSVRIVNLSGGMAYTIPCPEVSADYTIAKCRVQFAFGGSILSASFEDQNPYADRAHPWYIYNYEWLIRHLNNDKFMENNNLTRLNGTKAYEFGETHEYGDLETKPGYDVYRFDVKIEDGAEIERPYYNIAIIRKADDKLNFALFVLKSERDRADVMDGIVRSYTVLPRKGKAKNYLDAGQPKKNPRWTKETADCFDYLMNTDHTLWGVFSWSMPGPDECLVPTDPTYQKFLDMSHRSQEGIEKAWQYKYDIYPTYTHIGRGEIMHHFPNNMAEELAGGNGYNGKPVLQFTYQYTLDNNTVGTECTTMFDIIRGKFDDHFRRLARDVKAYGKPTIFRLNNEMNTDWTTYCGMMTLLDPDIFVMTWRRLYDIFEAEGVDNAIWLWNPQDRSCPFSNWGEDLCYFPGVDYVQFLGGTSYEMNNYPEGESEKEGISFHDRYKKLYEKNKPAFSKWGMIISEFACGSGNETGGRIGRNAAYQAKWVKEMFEDLNADPKPDWVKSLKGAVWFNCNDMADGKVSNRLCFYTLEQKEDDDLKATREEFRRGFAAIKK